MKPNVLNFPSIYGLLDCFSCPPTHCLPLILATELEEPEDGTTGEQKCYYVFHGIGT